MQPRPLRYLVPAPLRQAGRAATEAALNLQKGWGAGCEQTGSRAPRPSCGPGPSSDPGLVVKDGGSPGPQPWREGQSRSRQNELSPRP